MRGEIISIDTAKKLADIDKLKAKERKLKNAILKEITNCCENCKSNECYPEEECSIYKIEQLILKK